MRVVRCLPGGALANCKEKGAVAFGNPLSLAPPLDFPLLRLELRVLRLHILRTTVLRLDGPVHNRGGHNDELCGDPAARAALAARAADDYAAVAEALARSGETVPRRCGPSALAATASKWELRARFNRNVNLFVNRLGVS